MTGKSTRRTAEGRRRHKVEGGQEGDQGGEEVCQDEGQDIKSRKGGRDGGQVGGQERGQDQTSRSGQSSLARLATLDNCSCS